MTWWEKQDSVALATCIKGVIYNRNSADIGQENSCDIQYENNMAFAKKYGIEIIDVFEDKGKSGLDAEGRPAFQALMKRIVEDYSFTVILVNDVSRFGRFQDTDQSAHYEAVCRQHGKDVVYTASGEFDKSQKKTLIKQLEVQIARYQAADYSAVLSKKTKDGAMHVARQGYRPGGAPPYGMQRVMLNEQKQRDRVLGPGQRKGLQNGRTILEPGDPAIQAFIHEIFTLFVEEDYSEKQIAGHFNSRRIPSPGGGSWSSGAIHHILCDEQYAGSVVYNKTSGPLKSKSKPNPRG
jgi:DNA invertase Pin-like site-specific DNA recombinase